MKKAVLMTIFRVPNYGSVLQAFATTEILNDFGYKIDLIDYKYPNDWHFNKGTNKYKKSFVKKILLWLMGFIGIKKGIVQKNRLNKFISRHFNTSRKYKDLSSLENEDWSCYDLAVVGSDQVWNPRYLHGDKAFMLSFIPNSVRKVSIASSFATNCIPTELIPKYYKYLSKFSCLTTRERNGKEILENVLNIQHDVEIIPDPTLLLDSKRWSDKLNIKVFDRNSSEYLLFYYLNYSFDSAPYIFDVVKYLSNKYGLKVYVICGEQSNHIKNSLSRFKDCSGASVEKFISLFANASLVVTSSFHGTAFAVNYGKPLISVIPSSGDDRQESLLNLLGIKQCAVKKDTDFEELNPFYDKRQEQYMLKLLREHAISKLRDKL